MLKSLSEHLPTPVKDGSSVMLYIAWSRFLRSGYLVNNIIKASLPASEQEGGTLFEISLFNDSVWNLFLVP